MRFEHTMRYDAPPADVHAMVTDPAFREKVCEAVHSARHSTDVAATGGTVTVTVDQEQRVRNVPSYAARMVGDAVRIHQVEAWSSPSAADLDISVPGKPGQLRGRVTLEPSAAGTTQTVRGDLKVAIPLVGGKLEKFIAGLLSQMMTIEEELGRDWLAGNR
jgi:uncharacterized protein YndB with AHSA1/START domain